MVGQNVVSKNRQLRIVLLQEGKTAIDMVLPLFSLSVFVEVSCICEVMKHTTQTINEVKKIFNERILS